MSTPNRPRLTPSPGKTIVRVALLAAAGLWLHAASLPASDFLWRQDPETGLMVAQLTDSTIDNTDHYALYYHQDSLGGHGRYLVYRSIRANSAGTGLDTTTRAYWRLDLETGSTAELMPTGQAAEAFVRGNEVFLFHRATPTSPINTISVVDLSNIERAELINVGNTTLVGAVAVNADASLLIYQTLDDRIELFDRQTGAIIPVLAASHEIYQHFQFSPTDPGLFTFIKQGDPQGLQRVHIGRAVRGVANSITVTHQAMQAASRGEPLETYIFPHPFWGIDGRLWSDAITSTDPLLPNAYVPIRVDTDPDAGKFAQVSPSALLTITDDQWQLHQSTSRALNWFAGDGIGAGVPLGEPFIHLLRLDDKGCYPLSASAPCGTFEQLRLSSSLGADLQFGGNWESNAKTLETLDGVIFSAPWDFASGQLTPVIVTAGNPPRQNRPRNIFLVKLTNRLKARLAGDRIDDSIPGPWKAGHRITVDSAGVWRVDYGTPEGFGDGMQDDTLAGTIGDGYSLADLNGDDVEDRVTFSRDAAGIWTTEVAHSSYEGRLGGDLDGQRSDPASVGWLALDDLDGNGLDDLVRVSPQQGQLIWQGFLNQDAELPTSATPSVAYDQSLFGDATLVEHVHLADVNGDGYADRIVVERTWDTWTWKVDFSLPSSFGDGLVDSQQAYFGYPALDQPLADDVNGDGFADLVLARGWGGAPVQWIAYLSDKSGFGTAGVVYSTAGFGTGNQRPLIAHLARFPTANASP